MRRVQNIILSLMLQIKNTGILNFRNKNPRKKYLTTFKSAEKMTISEQYFPFVSQCKIG